MSPATRYLQTRRTSAAHEQFNPTLLSRAAGRPLVVDGPYFTAAGATGEVGAYTVLGLTREALADHRQRVEVFVSREGRRLLTDGVLSQPDQLDIRDAAHRLQVDVDTAHTVLTYTQHMLAVGQTLYDGGPYPTQTPARLPSLQQAALRAPRPGRLDPQPGPTRAVGPPSATP